MATFSLSRITYFLYRLAGATVPRIPPRLGYPLFAALGGVTHRVNAGARANVRNNLRHILGPQASETQVNRLARATFNYLSYNYYDLFRLPSLSADQVNQAVSVSGWENVEAALGLGKGVVMTSAHFGNIEVVLYAMLLRGVAITIPAERIDPPELFEYICNLRMSKGLKLIPVDGPMIDLFRTLRKGGVAGIAGDRNITEEGSEVTFFGHRTVLPDGHVRLAMKTGSPLIMGFSQRLGQDRYQAHFLPHFPIPKEGTEAERLAAGMAYIVHGMESAISAAPEQWTVTVPMWPD